MGKRVRHGSPPLERRKSLRLLQQKHRDASRRVTLSPDPKVEDPCKVAIRTLSQSYQNFAPETDILYACRILNSRYEEADNVQIADFCWVNVFDLLEYSFKDERVYEQILRLCFNASANESLLLFSIGKWELAIHILLERCHQGLNENRVLYTLGTLQNICKLPAVASEQEMAFQYLESVYEWVIELLPHENCYAYVAWQALGLLNNLVPYFGGSRMNELDLQPILDNCQDVPERACQWLGRWGCDGAPVETKLVASQYLIQQIDKVDIAWDALQVVLVGGLWWDDAKYEDCSCESHAEQHQVIARHLGVAQKVRETVPDSSFWPGLASALMAIVNKPSRSKIDLLTDTVFLLHNILECIPSHRAAEILSANDGVFVCTRALKYIVKEKRVKECQVVADSIMEWLHWMIIHTPVAPSLFDYCETREPVLRYFKTFGPNESFMRLLPDLNFQPKLFAALVNYIDEDYSRRLEFDYNTVCAWIHRRKWQVEAIPTNRERVRFNDNYEMFFDGMPSSVRGQVGIYKICWLDERYESDDDSGSDLSSFRSYPVHYS